MIVDFDYEDFTGCKFTEPQNSRVCLGALIVVGILIWEDGQFTGEIKLHGEVSPEKDLKTARNFV